MRAERLFARQRSKYRVQRLIANARPDDRAYRLRGLAC